LVETIDRFYPDNDFMILFCLVVSLRFYLFLINIDTQLKEVHHLVPTLSSFSASRGVCENSRGEIIVFDMKSNALVEMTFIKTKVKVTVKESDRITRPQAICIRETDAQILVACQISDSLEIVNACKYLQNLAASKTCLVTRKLVETRMYLGMRSFGL